MSRPQTLPDWATSAVYAGGPYPGQPNKAQPSGAIVAEGLEPGAGLPAEWVNQLWNNHGQWIDHHDAILLGREFYLFDDFTGSSVDTGKWTLTGTAPTTTQADTANGSWGALVCAAAVNGTSSEAFLVLPGTPNYDFLFSAAVRLPTLAAGSEVQFGFTDGGGNNALFSASGVGGVWGVQNQAGFHASAVAANATYAFFIMTRIGGVLTAFINGVQVYTGANAPVALATWDFVVEANDTTGAATLYMDYVRLWAVR